MFSLESPHRGDSNVYTQHTITNIKKKITLIYPKICRHGTFSKGLKNEFEAAVVNEPSVFEPLKLCCIYETTGKHSEKISPLQTTQQPHDVMTFNNFDLKLFQHRMPSVKTHTHTHAHAHTHARTK